MTKAIFSVNLRKETVDPVFIRAITPESYLLSPTNSTKVLVAEAAKMREKGTDIVLDNGNFTVVGELVDSYASKAAAALGARLDRAERLRKLVAAVETEAAQKVGAYSKIIDADKVKPSRLIGIENIVVATLLSLRIIDEVHYSSEKVGRINEEVARNSIEESAALADTYKTIYYAVASAFNYESAFSAGVAFGKYAVPNVAMGFGAFMSDDSYTDSIECAGKSISLESRVPNRYIRTALVARGFFDGYSSVGNKSPKSFHCLGLGAPIMFGLIRLASWGVGLMSYDATSPIKDATAGMLYSMKPAYLKLDCLKIAQRLASSTNKWICACDFCKGYTKKHPFDYEKGRHWFKTNSENKIGFQDLKKKPLSEAYPLLAQGKSDKERTFACTGHNHWVIKGILGEMDKNSRSKKQLQAHVNRIVDIYKVNTLECYARALDLTRSIITGNTIK